MAHGAEATGRRRRGKANNLSSEALALKEWMKTHKIDSEKQGGGSCLGDAAGGESCQAGEATGGENGQAGHVQGGESCHEGEEDEHNKPKSSDAVKQNMQRIAADKRAPRVGFAVMGNTATGCRDKIQADGQFQKMISGPPLHRICFCYSVSDAYGRMPPNDGEYNRRHTMPSVVWMEDFSIAHGSRKP